MCVHDLLRGLRHLLLHIGIGGHLLRRSVVRTTRLLDVVLHLDGLAPDLIFAHAFGHERLRVLCVHPNLCLVRGAARPSHPAFFVHRQIEIVTELDGAAACLTLDLDPHVVEHVLHLVRRARSAARVEIAAVGPAETFVTRLRALRRLHLGGSVRLSSCGTLVDLLDHLLVNFVASRAEVLVLRAEARVFRLQQRVPLLAGRIVLLDFLHLRVVRAPRVVQLLLNAIPLLPVL